MKKAFISLMFFFMSVVLLHPSPARRTFITLYQPDGSTVPAILRGDEFMRILTTTDGCSIVMGDGGYYCYAVYDKDGNALSSGYRAGGYVPEDVRGMSRMIPYRQLADNANILRSLPDDGRPNLIKRMNVRMPEVKSGMPAVVKHGIVLLVEFKDLKFKYTRSDFGMMLTQDGYKERGAVGSAKEYFDAQFDGRYDFRFDISDIVTLDKGYAYYGRCVHSAGGVHQKDTRAWEMVYEACMKADTNVDFSLYDDDGDGEVDNVFIFFAGGDEAAGAGENHIWSHAWYLKDGEGKELVLDGVLINRYACTSERASDGIGDDPMAGIGTFCHEYSHTFGLPDLYDTDYDESGGTSKAFWKFTSLMDGGNGNNGGNTPPYYNAVERNILGLSVPEQLTEGRYILEPVNRNGRFLRVDSGNPDEYYLLECRSAESWDSHIGGGGLLIYHIDSTSNDTGYGVKAYERWSVKGMYSNTVNCNPAHECADLIEAYPGATEVGQVFFPYTEAIHFTSSSHPAFRFWDGTTPDISITDIVYDGENVSFNVRKGEHGDIPAASITNVDVFQDAAIASWTADPEGGTAHVTFSKADGGDVKELSVEPYGAGLYAVVLDGLEPAVRYKLGIHYEQSGVTGKEVTRYFVTNQSRGGYPYIYLKYVERNTDGTFPSGAKLPLRLYNASDAEAVVWTMDGETVKVGADGYYTPRKSGLLEASVLYKDGTDAHIVKYIEIKEP